MMKLCQKAHIKPTEVHLQVTCQSTHTDSTELHDEWQVGSIYMLPNVKIVPIRWTMSLTLFIIHQICWCDFVILCLLPYP